MASQFSNVGHEPQCGLGSTRDSIGTHIERLLPDFRLDEPVGASPKENVWILANGLASDVLD